MMSELLFQNNEIIFKNGDGEFLVIFTPSLLAAVLPVFYLRASVHSDCKTLDSSLNSEVITAAARQGGPVMLCQPRCAGGCSCKFALAFVTKLTVCSFTHRHADQKSAVANNPLAVICLFVSLCLRRSETRHADAADN